MVPTNNTTFSFASQVPIAIGRLLGWTQVAPFGRPAPAENLQVSLTDVLGRSYGNIFDGNSEALSSKITLPSLISGVYFVNITLNGIHLSTQKLTINN